METEQLLFIRNGGETRRYHGWPVLRQQTNAEHQYHVAMICWVLLGKKEPGIRLPLIMAALCSDLAEWKTGDIPSPAKRAMDGVFPNFREKWNEMEEDALRTVELDWRHELTDNEARILSLADAIDGAMYCTRERAMGNTLIATCYDVYRKYIEELYRTDEDVELSIVQFIDDMWEDANER